MKTVNVQTRKIFVFEVVLYKRHKSTRAKSDNICNVSFICSPKVTPVMMAMKLLLQKFVESPQLFTVVFPAVTETRGMTAI